MLRVRFAPSPTGYLHIGGARTALYNYILAKKEGGRFVLRIDDTDRERSRPELEEDIKASLRWLGLIWDEGPDDRSAGDCGPYRQSERADNHKAAAEKLVASGKAVREADGAVRMRYPGHEIVVDDLVCGKCRFVPAALGPEPVLLRSDGTPTYHLASVCDDIDMKITHIVRGQDHLTNSAKHVVLFQAMGAEVPKFAHLPLILGEDGAKLSKRSSEGLVSVSEFRSGGYLPQALLNYLLLLGWSHPEGLEQISLDEAVKAFAIERVNQTGAKFEMSKLHWLNGWWLRHLPVAQVAEASWNFVGEYQDLISRRGEAFWHEVVAKLRGEVGLLTEFKSLAELLFSLDIEFSKEAQEKYSQAEAQVQLREVIDAWSDFLSEVPLDEDRDCYTEAQFGRMVKALKKKLTYEPKAIFQALRAAITGRLSGPELKVLVPLITRDVLVERAASARQRV
jgi:nondiscriminating glutamyl-tRNA synthetase